MGETSIYFSAPNTPVEEEYWQALIEDGEASRCPAPPAPPHEIWRCLGLINEDNLAPPEQTADTTDWETATRMMQEGSVLELTAVGYNRGGLLVEWNGQQGFVPISHLAEIPTYMDEQERERILQSRVGQVLRLKVIEVDPERSRLVLSERATRSDEEQRQMLLRQLVPGEMRHGRITNLCSFGAFVDLGGIEGLVHISEISWGRITHPSDVLRPGQQVKVCILNVDRERDRVGLSIKRAQPDPWQSLETRYSVGQIISATVTHVVDFGAFAQVEEGVEGLIHASELAEGSFLHPRNVVQEGQQVQAMIISLDPGRRRLALSLRRATPSA
jgi:small subunit ribosomal protein S1